MQTAPVRMHRRINMAVVIMSVNVTIIIVIVSMIMIFAMTAVTVLVMMVPVLVVMRVRGSANHGEEGQRGMSLIGCWPTRTTKSAARGRPALCKQDHPHAQDYQSREETEHGK